MFAELAWIKGGIGSLLSNMCFRLAHISLLTTDSVLLHPWATFSISYYIITADANWVNIAGPLTYCLILSIHTPFEVGTLENVLNVYPGNSITIAYSENLGKGRQDIPFRH